MTFLWYNTLHKVSTGQTNLQFNELKKANPQTQTIISSTKDKQQPKKTNQTKITSCAIQAPAKYSNHVKTFQRKQTINRLTG